MIRRLLIPISAFAAILAASPAAYSQSGLQVSVLANGFSTSIPAGASLTITANGIGQPLFSTVTVVNSATTAATITGVTVTGTSEIVLPSAVTVPFTLNAGASTSFSVEYLPSSGNAVTAQIAIAFTLNNQASNFQFGLIGTAPRLTFNYSLPSGSVTNLNNGDTIGFPTTNLGSSVQATVSVANAGSANAVLNSASVSGTGFQLQGSPAPVSILPGQQATVSILFAPQSSVAARGTLTLLFANGVSAIFSLSGAGAAPSFSVTYALADGNAHTLTQGAVISFPPVDINASTTATVTIANQGTGAGTITGISVSGTSFQLSGLPAFPATVPPGQGLRFGIVFAPTQSGSYTGSFLINLSGSSVSGSLTGSTAPSNISLAYLDPATNNIVALPNGATLSFPNTLVGVVTNITLVAANTGTGTGFLNSISIGGANVSAFQLLNLPALPLSVPPGQQGTFGIRFTPTQQQTYTASLTVTVNGQPLTINLSAQGTGPQFTYSSTTSTGTTAFSSGGTVALPDTNVGKSASATISISNAGSGNGQISGIGVTGQGLSLSGLPGLPLTLAPNASQQFTLNFAPAQPGAITGQLTIGTATFTITATAIGSQLTYSYTNAVASNPINDGATVIFAPIAVGNTEAVTFSVQNTGTSAATISSVNLASASVIFGLQQLPALPLSLGPGATIAFTVSFSPNNTGTLTATLAVNTSAFVLSGTGTPPPALPSYQFSGPSGTLQPAQQPAVGLTLSSAYPLPLQGTVKLTFVSAVFTDDPSIQFANGGRSVNFTVPANSTQAVFDGNNNTVALQSGTTAGTIVLTPSFATTGGFNLTPSSPPALTLTVPNSAPKLTAASVTSVTSTSFTLLLNGYSTTRVLNELDIQFTPSAGTSLTSSNLTINVSTASTTWFQGSASQSFGGSFLVAVPFTLQGGAASANLVSLLQSLTVAAKNDVGTSASLSVSIP